MTKDHRKWSIKERLFNRKKANGWNSAWQKTEFVNLNQRHQCFDVGRSAKASDLWSRKNWILHNDNATYQWTLIRKFLSKNTIASFRTRLVHQIYHLQKSIFSPSWKFSSNVALLALSPISRVNGRMSSRLFQEMTSRLDFKSGRDVETGVMMRDVTISKEIMLKIR